MSRRPRPDAYRISAASTAAKQERRDVYDAYRLGQASSVLYAYSKANHEGPAVNGQTQQQIAATEISQWKFSAQGYAESFHISTDSFNSFISQIAGAQPTHVSEAFSQLNSRIQTAADSRAVGAYELGWQTTVIAIGISVKPDTTISNEYPQVRDQLNADLRKIGAHYTLPDSVSSTASFVSVMKNVQKVLGELQP
jgi:hypothetical protein